jgi:signal transduction histidine kinase
MHPIARDEVYRIAYEAIRNACAHSGGNELSIELLYKRRFSLKVRDNGRASMRGYLDGPDLKERSSRQARDLDMVLSLMSH